MSGLPAAVLISGGGTTLRNLIQWRQEGRLEADLRLVVSSNPEAGGLRFARDAGIRCEVVPHRQFRSPAAIGERIFGLCERAQVRLAVCGGFLRRLAVPEAWKNRVINIHPSLIPQFCGQGMFGLRVHAAVLAAGERESGCTVHLVDDEYDHGPVLAQSRVPVLPGDTPDSLAQRVFDAECQLYPLVINRIARGEEPLVPVDAVSREQDI